jgi:single-stranded DNA-specific DHH superfamily exonuclease
MMLTQKQIHKIREHLDKSQNPLFLFDNDPDGLCAFLLLQRDIGRGKGVPIKGPPELSKDYFRKVTELGADYVFILDRPLVSKEFFEEIEKINIPVVWIDHHEVQTGIPPFVDYYNPYDGKENFPTSYLCYQVSRKKEEDLWLAVVGCIADAFIPDFYKKFCERYPDLGIDSKNFLEIYYKSPVGKIGKIFSFGLKDKTSNVISMIKFLVKAKSPYDVLEESGKNYAMHRRFNEINKKITKLIEKVKEGKFAEKILFFKYSGDLSISSDLANELKYRFPDKIIIVAYIDEGKGKANISVRGENIKSIILKILKNFENSTGGGHENAVGVQIRKDDLGKFEEILRKEFDRKI